MTTAEEHAGWQTGEDPLVSKTRSLANNMTTAEGNAGWQTGEDPLVSKTRSLANNMTTAEENAGSQTGEDPLVSKTRSLANNMTTAEGNSGRQTGEEEMVEEEDDEVDEDDEDDVEQMLDQSGKDDSYHENGGEACKRTAKSSSKPVKKGPPQAPRHVWTREEKAALERQFPLEIKLGKTPGQLKCQTAINSEKILASFSWKSIEYAVRNIITSRKRIFQK